MHYEYEPKGTCSQLISFDLDGDVVRNVKFLGGCSGNTQGVAALVDGLTTQQIEDKLLGIKCGYKPTSCPDQLAHGVIEAVEYAKAHPEEA